MKKPTPAQIKQSGILGPHFFSASTLRFFGQNMASFRTQWHDRDSGVVKLSAPIYDFTGQRMGTTERYLQIQKALSPGSFTVLKSLAGH